MKPTAKTHHLEVMVGGCDGREFAAIREFFEHRGYRLTESRHGEVYRLWAEKPRGSPLRESLGDHHGEQQRREERAEGREAGLSQDELRIGANTR